MSKGDHNGAVQQWVPISANIEGLQNMLNIVDFFGVIEDEIKQIGDHGRPDLRADQGAQFQEERHVAGCWDVGQEDREEHRDGVH